MRCLASSVVVFGCLVFCGLLRGADDADGPVYTDPAMADADFAFQGEFRGYQRPTKSPRSSVAVGLQVIARGDGKFEAVKFYGGLPGDGWYGGERYRLQGEVEGDVVILRGGQYTIVVDGDAATLTASDGRPAGELQRMVRISPTMNAAPPESATVLFDGDDHGELKKPKISEAGLLLGGTETVKPYRNFRLHGEFLLPYKPRATGQARGNSGFYLQGRYEVQVLDSFGLEGVENECGALYKARRPDVNMCLPPLQWQTYDIDFTAAGFDDAGQKVSNMRISVWHNGVLIHDNAQILNKTGGGAVEGPQPLPIKLQDHGNPVQFRNLWIVDTSAAPQSGDWLKLPIRAAPVPIVHRESPGSLLSFAP